MIDIKQVNRFNPGPCQWPYARTAGGPCKATASFVLKSGEDCLYVCRYHLIEATALLTDIEEEKEVYANVSKSNQG